MARGKTGVAALAVATGILLSRCAGLVRDRIFAYYLGSSEAAGAFRAALRIPNLLQNLFGEGVLSAAFIPVYARLRAEGRDDEAVRLAGAVATLLFITVTLLAALGTLGAPWCIDVLAPGFTGEVRALTVRLVQIMFPGTALLVMSAWCLGVLNSHRHFLLSYVAPVLWNAAIIAALLLYGPARMQTTAGQMDLATYAAWGTVVGCALQLAVQLPLALRLTAGLRPRVWPLAGPERSVLRSFGPVVLGRGVVQVSAYIDGIIASYLGASLVAALAYAQQLYLLPVSLFGMSIAAAELPAMASVTGSRDEVHAALRGKLAAGLRRVSYFVIPSAVALAVLGDVVVAALFLTGTFTRYDVAVVWMILIGSSVGLLATTQARLFATAFYALQDTRRPLRIACLRVAVAAVAGYLVALPLRSVFGYDAVTGAAAMTACTGAAGWLELVLLRRTLAAEIGTVAVGKGVAARLWGTALLAAGLALGVKWMLPDLYPVLTGIIVLGIFGAVYVGLTMALGVADDVPLPRRLAALRRRLKLR